MTSRANATFSQTVLDGSSLKSWKMIPILRRIRGTWRRGRRARSWPSSTTSPRVATSSRMSSLISVDLPAPDGPTRNTKSPSGIDQVDVAQGQLAVRVALRHVVEDEHGAFRDWPGRALRPRTRAPNRAGRARWWGGDHRSAPRSRLTSGRPPAGVAGRTPSAGTARSHAGRLPPAGERQTRPAHRRSVAEPRTAPACQSRPGRDRQVAREVGERAVPADEDRELVEPEAGAAGRHDRPVRGAADPDREGAARRDGRGQVAEDRREQGLVADGDRPEPTGLAGVAVAERRAVRAAVEPAVPLFAPQEPVVDAGARRRGTRGRGASIASTSFRWPAPPGGPAAISSNASGTTPDGSVPNASGRARQPRQVSSGMRGTIPYVAYSAFEIGWALSVAVARAIVVVGRQHPSEQLAARRPRPGTRAGRTASTGTRAARGRPPRRRRRPDRRPIAGASVGLGRDDEPFRVGRLEVR